MSELVADLITALAVFVLTSAFAIYATWVLSQQAKRHEEEAEDRTLALERLQAEADEQFRLAQAATQSLETLKADYDSLYAGWQKAVADHQARLTLLTTAEQQRDTARRECANWAASYELLRAERDAMEARAERAASHLLASERARRAAEGARHDALTSLQRAEHLLTTANRICKSDVAMINALREDVERLSAALAMSATDRASAAAKDARSNLRQVA